MKRAIFYVSIITASILGSCKKPFNPPVTTTNLNYLIVEGFISGGNDSTLIKLSRMAVIADTSVNKPETGATVTVEDDQNTIYNLKEITKGYYGIAAIGLNNNRKYHVRVKTTDGLIYLSDLEPVKNSPPIDSIGYKVTANGISLYNNTHDPLNNTTYYRWEYKETWKFHTNIMSSYEYNGTQVIVRPASDDIYFCFANDTSTHILLGSTAKLTQDVIFQSPLFDIPSNSEKIELRYSILLKQYALPKEAYDYWQNLQTNTENLGSIFDAQPSVTTGNIHCISNPAVPVVGYIGAGLVQQKRIFIDRSALPQQWLTAHPYSDCPLDSIALPLIASKLAHENNGYSPFDLFPLTPFFSTATGALAGYIFTYRNCTDCTIRGKVATPAFWK